MPYSPDQPSHFMPSDVIDLACFFHQDRDLSVMEKHERDREIALGNPDAKDDMTRLYTWLHVMRERQGMDDQRPIHDMHQGLRMVLFVIGMVIGAFTVGGWLSLHKLFSPEMTSSGVNVIYFWSVTVGWQVLMLIVLVLGIALGDWTKHIPGLSGLRRLLHQLPSLMAHIAKIVIRRVQPSQQDTLNTLRTWLTESRRYQRLMFWYPLNLWQHFAVGLNLGLAGMFLFFSFAAQPDFRWQSEQFSCTGLEQATRIISWPWYWLVPQGRPSPNHIRMTYRHPDPVYAHNDCQPIGGDTTPNWWPFLFVSMLVYGLIPRIMLDMLSSWQVRRATHHVVLHHPDSRELLLRMQRPLVDTGARLQPAPVALDTPVASPHPEHAEPLVSFGRGFILKWAGIQIPNHELCDWVRHQWGIDTVALYEVGGLDISRDEVAFRALKTNPDIDQVMLLVEAWQPPVTDYRNFVTQLRRILHDGKMIWVLLYHRDRHGKMITPRESDLAQWRTTLERIDAWLRVKPMIEEPA